MEFATDEGAQIYAELTEAICLERRRTRAICVDVGPILNGPTLDEPVDENSP